MEKNNTSKAMGKIASIVTSALIPAVINFLAITSIYPSEPWCYFEEGKFTAGVTVIAILISCVISMFLDWLVPKIPWFREFRSYEGRWLQIIPDFSRPYSIIDFTYNAKLGKYELQGINFYQDLTEGAISFDAYRFVERSFCNGFYYITNHTSENRNGLGKLGIVKSNYDNLTRAEGYFFDVGDGKNATRYDTILIKCNQAFFEHLGPQYKYFKMKKVAPIEIMKISQKFAKSEIKSYKRRMKDSANNVTKNSKNCIHCSCSET